MKKLKLKAFVLLMVVMMGLTLVPSLYAVADNKYQNAEGRTEENSDIAVKMELDKTEATPGEEVVASIDVTKLPDNGLGMATLSMSILPAIPTRPMRANII